MKTRKVFVAVCLALAVSGLAVSLAAAPAPVREPQDPKPISSEVVPWSDKPQTFPWGEMRKAFTGESYGTQKLFISSFVLKGGMEVHPPHRHAQEEWMTMVEGSGTWHLDGKEIPAKKGDVIYVAPWSRHGLKNTSDAPLVYFVVQFNARGVKVPEDPEKGK